MNTELINLFGKLVDLSPIAMMFVLSLSAIVVAGLALVVVLMLKQK